MKITLFITTLLFSIYSFAHNQKLVKVIEAKKEALEAKKREIASIKEKKMKEQSEIERSHGVEKSHK